MRCGAVRTCAPDYIVYYYLYTTPPRYTHDCGTRRAHINRHTHARALVKIVHRCAHCDFRHDSRAIPRRDGLEKPGTYTHTYAKPCAMQPRSICATVKPALSAQGLGSSGEHCALSVGFPAEIGVVYVVYVENCANRVQYREDYGIRLSHRNNISCRLLARLTHFRRHDDAD